MGERIDSVDERESEISRTPRRRSLVLIDFIGTYSLPMTSQSCPHVPAPLLDQHPQVQHLRVLVHRLVSSLNHQREHVRLPLPAPDGLHRLPLIPDAPPTQTVRAGENYQTRTTLKAHAPRISSKQLGPWLISLARATCSIHKGRRGRVRGVQHRLLVRHRPRQGRHHSPRLVYPLPLPFMVQGPLVPRQRRLRGRLQQFNQVVDRRIGFRRCQVREVTIQSYMNIQFFPPTRH